MARARMLKPSFFTNEHLGGLSFGARLVFQGLWCVADREGKLEDRPSRLKVEIMPYDKVNIDALLQALHDAGFIVRYQSGGGRYIQILNFAKHQRIHPNEAASSIPDPPQDHPRITPGSPQDHPKTVKNDPDRDVLGRSNIDVRATKGNDRSSKVLSVEDSVSNDGDNSGNSASADDHSPSKSPRTTSTSISTHTQVDRSTPEGAGKARPVGVGVGKPQRRDRPREDGADLSMEELRGAPFDIVAACDSYLGRCLWDWFPMLDEMKRDYQPEELQHAFEEARRRRGKTPQYVRSIIEGRRHDDAGSGAEDPGQRRGYGAASALTLAEYQRLQQESASAS